MHAERSVLAAAAIHRDGDISLEITIWVDLGALPTLLTAPKSSLCVFTTLIEQQLASSVKTHVGRVGYGQDSRTSLVRAPTHVLEYTMYRIGSTSAECMSA